MSKRFAIAGLCAAALASAAASPAPAQEVRVGVENSQAFRVSEETPSLFGAPGSRALTAAAGAAPRLAPLTFEDQADLLGADVFHFPVYADPDAGRYARGAAAGVAALRASGLKVVDPERADADAVCFTLMTCLMAVDAWAQARPQPAPVFVVLDARAEPRPRRLGRLRAVALADARPEAPAWTRLAQEVATALPDARRTSALAGEPGKITVFVRGGRGPIPDKAPFVVAGDDGGVRLIDAGAPAWVVTRHRGAAAFVGVIGATWSGPADARALFEAGVDLVVVAPDAARAPPSG